MSHLVIASVTEAYALNVLSFSSPIYETISSVQTHNKAVHYPIRISQPDIEFSVIFRNEKNYERFQRFIRNHQQNCMGVPSLLTLNWPERNISNWSGVVEEIQAGGARRNFSPRATFRVTLIDSMVTRRTNLASQAPLGGWRTIYGGFGMAIDAVLSPPSAAELQHDDNLLNGPFGGPGVGSAPF